MIQLFKAKSLKKTRESLTSNVEEKTREKAILKEGIGTNREATCTRGGRTRASLFGTYTPSKMAFAVQGTKGRSMVEMLGVLAIIGVLSIGGIQGYTMAMRKYRANEILSVANKYALLLYTSCQNAMQQNPDKYYISDTPEDYYGHPDNSTSGVIYMPWICPRLNFTDAGLGPLPTGVTSLYLNAAIGTIISSDGVEGSSYDSDKPTPLYPNGTNFVMLGIYFDSVELCETAFSIMGSSSFSGDDWDCAGKKGFAPLFMEN